MTTVIPYRFSMSTEELRYAIRSLHKHFKQFDKVVLVGDKPNWYTGLHVSKGDLPYQKEQSIMLKVLFSGVPEQFLYMNDDIFALEDFDEELPDYFDRSCGEMRDRHRVKEYQDMYANCNPAWNNYDVHAPMMMNMGYFRPFYQQMTEQLPIKTMYARNFGDRDAHLADCKIRGEHTYQEIKDIIEHRPFFSTHDDAINSDMLRVLQELYPDPSPYESN